MTAVPVLETIGLGAAWESRPSRQVLRSVDLRLAERSVTALLGPTGAGKSTLLRCWNRTHEMHRGAAVTGRVLLDGQDVYGPGVEVTTVRRRVALVTSPPAPFRGRSIRENVLTAFRFPGAPPLAARADDDVEKALRLVGLWDDVHHRLDALPMGLSRGQQQLLCVARALALGPRMLLLDEPFAALDPEAIARLEEVIERIRGHLTVVLVPSTVQQAGRVCTHAALLLGGRLVEFGVTGSMFPSPTQRETEDYLTGKFG